MRRMKMVLFAALLMFCFSAWSVMAAGLGKKPDKIPPKLQSPFFSDEMIWDRPEAFGPVPKKMKKLGKQVCGKDKIPVGYHPKAQDKEGKTFPKGGFLCEPLKK